MFDVVVPAYNASRFLAETLDAITKQSFLPHSVIVVDDGSTDDTAQIALRYGPLVRCITIPNGGQGLARRIGIEQCTAPWIALCDSDDIWNADHLQRRKILIENCPDASFTYSEFHSFGPNADTSYQRLRAAPKGWSDIYLKMNNKGIYYVTTPYLAFSEFNPVFPSGMAFKRNIYIESGGFIAKYSRWIAEDFEFTLRFAHWSNIVVVGDGNISWGYRRHENNYSKTSWKNIYGEAKILQEHIDVGLIRSDYLLAIKEKIQKKLTQAFDDAYWKKDKNGVQLLWSALPQESKNFKRLAKRYFIRFL